MGNPYFNTWISSLLVGIFLSSCATDPIFQHAVTEKVDPSVSFTILKNSPAALQGKTLILGGEILSVTHMKKGTRLEVLQLPLDEQQEPVMDRMQSQGRFLALQTDFPDPATLPPGSRISLVGKVHGATTLPFGESEYTYPVLTIKNLHLWPSREQRYRNVPGFYWGPYWGPYMYPEWYW